MLGVSTTYRIQKIVQASQKSNDFWLCFVNRLIFYIYLFHFYENTKIQNTFINIKIHKNLSY